MVLYMGMIWGNTTTFCAHVIMSNLLYAGAQYLADTTYFGGILHAHYTRLTAKFLAGHAQACTSAHKRTYTRSKNKWQWRFDSALSL